MYPHKNFEAHKGHKCHCTRHTGWTESGSGTWSGLKLSIRGGCSRVSWCGWHCWVQNTCREQADTWAPPVFPRGKQGWSAHTWYTSRLTLTLQASEAWISLPPPSAYEGSFLSCLGDNMLEITTLGVDWLWTQLLCHFWWEWAVWREECKF